MSPGTRILAQIAYDALLIFLAFGSVVACAFGLALIFRRSWAVRASERMNTWVSTRRGLRSMEAPRDVQRYLYKWHRGVGVAIVLCAAYVLYVLLARYNAAPIVAYFSRYMRPGVASWLLDWFYGFVLVTNAAAFVIGVLVTIRPSLLKGLESWANRSYSGRPAGKSLEVMHHQVDQYVLAYPRVFGTAVLVGGLYVLGSLAWLLLNSGP